MKKNTAGRAADAPKTATAADKTLRKTVAAALLAAVCAVSTMAVKIPIGGAGGYVNLGDFAVLLSGFLLGPVWGGAAAGVGSMLADVLSSYVQFAPGTFVIKWLMAAVFALVSGRKTGPGLRTSRLVAAAVAGEALMIAGYFFYESTILRFGPGAASGIPGNAVQGAVGATLAVLIVTLLNRNGRATEKIIGYLR